MFCFAGYYEETNVDSLVSFYVPKTEKYNEWVCAFTDKRIIMGQTWRPSRLKLIPYEKLYDINICLFENEMLIIISTDNEEITVMMQSSQARHIKKELGQILQRVKTQKEEMKKQMQSFSSADEIRKFKALCDDGIITEEEFQKKKTELLDISRTSTEDVLN